MFCQLLSGLVPLLDQVHVRLRRADARFGFFLKSVQHVQLGAELHGVDSSVSVLILAFDNFKNATTHPMKHPSTPLGAIGTAFGEKVITKSL